MTARRDVADLYRGQPRHVRAHVLARLLTCPFEAVAAEVPLRGRVLDIGCGHGVLANLLALSEPEREVIGVDVSESKIAAATAAANRLAAPVHFSCTETLPGGPFDAIVIVDVLYLMRDEEQDALLAACRHRLGPGGILLVKEMDRRPRWKHVWNVVQEVLAVRVLRITEGATLNHQSAADLRAALTRNGFSACGKSVHKGYPHPHFLFTATAADPSVAP